MCIRQRIYVNTHRWRMLERIYLLKRYPFVWMSCYSICVCVCVCTSFLPRSVCLANIIRVQSAVHQCNPFCCNRKTCKAGHFPSQLLLEPLCIRASHDKSTLRLLFVKSSSRKKQGKNIL